MLLPHRNDSAEPLHNQLQTIADAEDEYAVAADVVDESVGEGGGIWSVDGVGSARENDDARGEVGDGGEWGSARDAEGEDREGTDSPSDEVRVLGAEVEDEDEIRLHFSRVHGRFPAKERGD